MDKDVYISIVGKQEIDGNCDTVELVTEGKISKNDGVISLFYSEDEMTGHGKSMTQLVVDSNNTVTLTRSGDTNTLMVFEKGKRHMGHYETKYGDFTVGVSSSDVKVKMTDMGGEIDIAYILDINNIARTKNDLKLQILTERKK